MKFLWTVCLGLMVLSTQSGPVPENLVANPGMEEIDPKGVAIGWGAASVDRPDSPLSLDNKIARSGKNSLRVGTGSENFIICASTAIAVKPNSTYYVTWWCRTEGMKMARAYLWLKTNKGQRVLPNAEQSLTQEWTQYFAEYTTTAEETSLSLVPTTHQTGSPSGCYAWFDDVGVYEGGFPPELATQYQGFLRTWQGFEQTASVLTRSTNLTVWADHLSAKIYREDGVPAYAQPAGQVTLSGARGEQNYVQVAVFPATDLPNVELVPADLEGPGRILAAQVEWWPVGYCNLIKAGHNVNTRLGLTPDPLLKTGPVDAKAGENTPFLISVHIPQDAKAGTYRGRVTVTSAGRMIAEVPLAVEVFNFELPQDPAFRTLIHYSAERFRPWDSRPLNEIDKDIARVLHAHGVRGSGAMVTVPARIAEGKVVCDFTEFDRRLHWYIDEMGFNAFSLGPFFGGGAGEGWEKHNLWLGTIEPLSETFNRLFPDYLRQVAQHLRQKGWLEMAYLYLWDEPEPDYFDKVVALLKLALQADPGFKVFETTSPNYTAFWAVVKAWSIPFSRPYFNEETVEKRRTAGDEIWVYNIPTSLEDPTQLLRLWFWQAVTYGATGAQLWETTFYNKIDPWENITPVPWVTGRKGHEGLYVYTAGEAILLYPDKQGGPPLPSLRLKLVQKGIDDAGYLILLRQRLMAQAQANKLPDPHGYALKEMRKLSGEVVKNISRLVTDTHVLDKTRTTVAHRIETP